MNLPRICQRDELKEPPRGDGTGGGGNALSQENLQDLSSTTAKRGKFCGRAGSTDALNTKGESRLWLLNKES